MSEYIHPDNPFPVSDNFKQVTPALINAAVETLAFVGAPLWGVTPERLLVLMAHEWATRITGVGAEDVSHALVWELSSMTARFMHQGIPFPPFDITSRCGDDDCEIDHAAQTRVVNGFFEAVRNGQHLAAVKTYIQCVHEHDTEEWSAARVKYAAMLLVHVAERVSEYRSNAVEELPSLG